jgi:hypothetical protein
MFLHLVGSACHVVHFSASRPRNINGLFSIIGWARCGFHKKCRTHYTELVFLHSLEYVSHVVHSDASGARNVVELFFMLGGGGGAVSLRVCREMLRRSCVFVSGGIYGSLSALRHV